MRPELKNRILLAAMIFAALFLGGLLLVLTVRAVNRNQALMASIEVLEKQQEKAKLHYEQQIAALEGKIRQQEQINRNLKQQLLDLRHQKSVIKRNSYEDKLVITHIHAIDSLWQQIARHYRR